MGAQAERASMIHRMNLSDEAPVTGTEAHRAHVRETLWQGSMRCAVKATGELTVKSWLAPAGTLAPGKSTGRGQGSARSVRFSWKSSTYVRPPGAPARIALRADVSNAGRSPSRSSCNI